MNRHLGIYLGFLMFLHDFTVFCNQFLVNITAKFQIWFWIQFLEYLRLWVTCRKYRNFYLTNIQLKGRRWWPKRDTWSRWVLCLSVIPFARVQKTKEITLGQSTGLVSRDLLYTMFASMWQHVWFSILPSNSQDVNISSGTRQKMEHIVPLLVHCYLLTKILKAKNGYNVNCTKWNEFILLKA